MSKMATRIKIASFDCLLRFCEKNRRSMIRCAVRLPYMPRYKHHYILLGHTWNAHYEVFFIIHYSTETKNGMVVEQIYTRTQVEKDIMKGLYVLKDDLYPQNEAQFDEAYSRFEEKKGEQCYNLLTNNCEHLANYIMTGVAFSDQINTLSWSEQFVTKFHSIFRMSSTPMSSSISNYTRSSSSRGRNLPPDLMSSVKNEPHFVSKIDLGKIFVICCYLFFFFLSLYLAFFSVTTEYFNTFPLLCNNQDVIILWIAFLIFYCISFYFVIVRTRHFVSKTLSELSIFFLIFLVICDDHLERKHYFILICALLILIVCILILPLLLLVFLKTCWIIINEILFD